MKACRNWPVEDVVTRDRLRVGERLARVVDAAASFVKAAPAQHREQSCSLRLALAETNDVSSWSTWAPADLALATNWSISVRLAWGQTSIRC